MGGEERQLLLLILDAPAVEVCQEGMRASEESPGGHHQRGGDGRMGLGQLVDIMVTQWLLLSQSELTSLGSPGETH